MKRNYSPEHHKYFDDLKVNSFNLYKQYNNHGGPFDRGGADSYYGRNIEPHYHIGNKRIEQSEMNDNEIDAYLAGYFWNEMFGDKNLY